MTMRQAQQAHQHANALNPPFGEHVLGPLLSVWSDPSRLAKPIRRPAFHGRDLLRDDVLGIRAELPFFPLQVNSDLLEPVVEHPNHSACGGSQRTHPPQADRPMYSGGTE